jgi:hypothetical protein
VEVPRLTFDSPLPGEPEAITAAFVADYKEWNDFAFAVAGDGRDFDAAEDAYDALIAKYCRPGKQRQGLAFGGDSAHSPETSEIVDVKGQGRSTEGDRPGDRGPWLPADLRLRFHPGGRALAPGRAILCR